MTCGDGAEGSPVPRLLIPLTVQVYFLLGVNRMIRTGLFGAPEPELAPPFEETHATLKFVFGLPLPEEATQLTVTCPLVTLTACTFTGGIGAPTTAAGAAVDAGLLPIALVAFTTHRYVLAVVSDVTTIGLLVPATECAAPPFVDEHVATNFVIGLPFAAPAVNETVSGPVFDVAMPGTAFTPLGADGAFRM